ncbi:cytidylyltransferase family-domain-containing protein [Scheffersomyces xylosifermentans]|uniref:cytidylyltransferase family-domain-containing protein n=1 Tax=Scheffersomyces xylosifermentans TaxID=1304137 RepID=UPI00315DE83D
MTSVPSTPKTPRAPNTSVARKQAKQTPKSVSIAKATSFSFDGEDSYIEEEDATYMFNDTTSLSEDEDYDNDEDDEGDFDAVDEMTSEDTTEVELDENIVSDKLSTETTTTIREESTIVEEVDQNQPDVPESKFRQFLVKHEISRKVLHSSIGVFTLWLYTLGVTTSQLPLPLFALAVVIFLNDYIRFKNPELNKKIVKQFWFIIREKEVDTYNGVLYYLIGLVIVFLLFPKDICLMSVLLLSWADTAASTIGRKFGKYTPKISKGKSVAGSLASFVAGVLSCYLLYGYFIPVYDSQVNRPGDIFWSEETSNLSFLVYALFSGAIASVSEFINLWDIDDNFTIPVLSAVFLYGLVTVAHI